MVQCLIGKPGTHFYNLEEAEESHKAIAECDSSISILFGPIECVHMTSWRPCWRSKQRNGGHVGGVKYSFGDWTLFLCKSLLLFHYANMVSGHMSEHTLFYWPVSPFFEGKGTHDPLWTILLQPKKHQILVSGAVDYNGTGLLFCISVTTTPSKNMNVSFGN